MSLTERLERVAQACYERYLTVSGDFTSHDWARLTTAEREQWREVVLTAWNTE